MIYEIHLMTGERLTISQEEFNLIFNAYFYTHLEAIVIHVDNAIFFIKSANIKYLVRKESQE